MTVTAYNLLSTHTRSVIEVKEGRGGKGEGETNVVVENGGNVFGGEFVGRVGNE